MIIRELKHLKSGRLDGKKLKSVWSEHKRIWPRLAREGEMVLNIISPSDGFMNLSYILGNDPNGEYTENATLDWGDGSEVISILGNEWTTDRTRLQHTYSEKNKEYKITIKGKIKWSGNEQYSYIPANTRYAIISIELPTNNSPIQFITTYGFCDLKLQSIPEGLLDNCTEVTDFNGCFYNNAQLQSITEHLFDKCTKATSFYSCFGYCTQLQSIPDELFDNCIKVTRFARCFNYCMSLQSIPEHLFDNCTEVTDFERCFNYCTSLQSIPEHLFDNCTEVTRFDWCFYNCRSITHDLPTLWISHPSAFHDVCFNFCNKAPNYADAYRAGWATNPAITLSLNVPSDNFVLDLSQYIKPNNDADEVSVDWGDKTIETLSIDDIQHTYQSKGEYIVEIDGDIEWVEPRTRSIGSSVITNVTKKADIEATFQLNTDNAN